VASTKERIRPPKWKVLLSCRCRPDPLGPRGVDVEKGPRRIRYTEHIESEDIGLRLKGQDLKSGGANIGGIGIIATGLE
jgi:hypothetical protein